MNFVIYFFLLFEFVIFLLDKMFNKEKKIILINDFYWLYVVVIVMWLIRFDFVNCFVIIIIY